MISFGLGDGSLFSEGLATNYLDQIYEKIAQEQCVLILGPQLPTIQLPNGSEIQLQEALSKELAGFLQNKHIDFDNTQLQLDYLAMRCFNSNLPEVSPQQLPRFVQKVYNQCASQIPAIYQEFIKLPFHLVFNVGFDTYMQQAWAGKSHQAYYNYKSNSTEAIPDFSVEHPLVYNLFGIYTDPDSMVLSTDQQLDYLNKLLGSVSKVPNSILSRLTKDTLFLFMGFDNDSRYLPLLFKALNFQQHSAAFYYYQQKKLPQSVEDTYRDVFDFQFKDLSPLELIKQISAGYPEWKKKQALAPPVSRAYSSKPERDAKSGKTKVMFLTSNPKNTQQLNLNKEYNKVSEEMRGKEDIFELQIILDVNKNTLTRVLNTHHPQIIHFSGHGVDTGLLFYSDNELADNVSGEQLGKVLSGYDSISCILLNACYSETQAVALAQHIPCVIGVSGAIGDNKAITFAERFYRHIFADCSYEEAYTRAIAEVELNNMTAQFVFFKDGKQLYKDGQLV